MDWKGILMDSPDDVFEIKKLVGQYEKWVPFQNER